MRTIYFLNNIPTPYRNHFYNCVQALGDEKGFRVKVFFMSKTRQGRYWNYEDMDMRYDFEILKDFGFAYQGTDFHFNPAVVSRIYRDKPDYFIVGGAWNTITTSSILFTKGLFGKTKVGFWNEGNLVDEIHSKKPLISKMKRRIYSGFDFIVSSGKESDKLIMKYVENPQIIRLVNIIEESKYTIQDNEMERDNPSVPRVILIVSRLIGRKNVPGFLHGILPLLKDGQTRVKIAGDGEEKEEIQDWISTHHLGDEVLLLGNLDEAEVIEEYKRADIFCLASIREPFPLSPIEASFMAKPLLLSNKLGSIPEIYTGTNGFIFDPHDPNDILEKTRQMLLLQDEALKEMGRNARQHVFQNFYSMKVVEEFVDELLTV